MCFHSGTAAHKVSLISWQRAHWTADRAEASAKWGCSNASRLTVPQLPLELADDTLCFGGPHFSTFPSWSINPMFIWDSDGLHRLNYIKLPYWAHSWLRWIRIGLWPVESLGAPYWAHSWLRWIWIGLKSQVQVIDKSQCAFHRMWSNLNFMIRIIVFKTCNYFNNFVSKM